jgi:hypothetical protein
LEGKLKFKNKLNKKLSRTERKKIKKEIKKLNANSIQNKNQSKSYKDNLSLTGNNNLNNLNNLKQKIATTKHFYDKPLNFFNNKPISYFM